MARFHALHAFTVPMDHPQHGNLFPEALIASAAQESIDDFLTRVGNVHFLLINMDDPSGELAAGLVTSEINRTGQAQPALNVLGFHTVVGSVEGMGASSQRPGFSVAQLARVLSESPHFAAPLQKSAADGTYQERISVGRARNKDVVLRHRSVSKFHAWFEVNDTGALCVADAGSKNGTRLNGELLEPRTLTPVHSGDRIRIGGVECVLCEPEVVWGVAQRSPY